MTHREPRAHTLEEAGLTAQQGPGTERSAWGPAVLLFLLACLVFVPSLPGGFVYDDRVLVEHNPLVRPPVQIGRIFSSEYWAPLKREGLYRPLTILSFALNRVVTGSHPAGFHAVNLLLHGIATAGVYLFFRMLFADRKPALLAGSLFAIHPIHSEAVASIAGRADLLYTVFLLAGLAAFHGSLTARGRARRHGLLALSMAAYGLSLLSKESGLAFVGLALVTLAFVPRKGRWIRSAPHFGLYGLATAAYLLVKKGVTGQVFLDRDALSFVTNPQARAGFWARVTGLKVVALYLERLVFPARLASDYSYAQVPVASSLFEPGIIAGGLSLAVAGAGVMISFRKTPGLSFGLLFLFCLLVAVSNLLFPIGTVAGERLAYLACAGYCLALASLWLTRVKRRRIAVAAWIVLCVLFSARTALRCRVFADEERFFTAQVNDAPHSAAARRNLADLRYRQGLLPEAARLYDQALGIHPDFPAALNGKGLVLLSEGNVQEALALFTKSLSLNTRAPEPWINLGAGLLSAGKTGQALHVLEKAVSMRPESAPARTNLARALLRQGRPGEAAGHVTVALSLDPGLPQAHRVQGLIFQVQGEREKAARAFNEAVRMEADERTGLLNLAAFLHQEGHLDLALSYLGQAQAGFPEDSGLLSLLGTIQLQKRDFEAAASTLSKAFELDPSNRAAGQNLAVALINGGRAEQAIPVLRGHLERFGKDPEICFNLALSCLMAGRETERGIRAISDALSMRPENASFYDLLAGLYHAAGNLSAAIDAQERAVAFAAKETQSQGFREKLEKYRAQLEAKPD